MINFVVNIILGIFSGIITYMCFINKLVIKGPNSREIIGNKYMLNNNIVMFEPHVETE